jgi:hypothetical protein
VDILFAAQQKAKHFVEYNLFESGMKLGMWKCSGKYH